MNNYTENNAFSFGIEPETISMFNTEVYRPELDVLSESRIGENLTNTTETSDKQESVISQPDSFMSGVFNTNLEEINPKNDNNAFNVNSFVTPYSKDILDETKEDTLINTESNFNQNLGNEQINNEVSSNQNLDNEQIVKENKEIEEQSENTKVEVLEQTDNSFDKKTEELADEINSETNKIQMSESDLTSLTTFSEDKVEKTDIKELFDRVGINVKEASDVFKRNTEMKEKLDSRFEELKKLQLDVARKKEEQYAEINAYKEEVLGKLTEKKDEIERRLNKLKEFQSTLEKEKEEFEQYRKQQKEEIERVQKEVQEAYDSRREELNHIEDVLRRQKDLLDEERSQLSLDKIQYESDKNELANNLLKFNEIVDSFTNGIDKLDKE